MRALISKFTQLSSNSVLLIGFFAFITIGLFLGDGKQALIDTYCAGGIIALFVYAKTYCLKKRSIPTKITYLWGFVIVYLVIRTFFSDDVGFSITATVRVAMGYLIYLLFHEYANDSYQQLFISLIVVFSLLATSFATLFLLFPHLATVLPLMNLLLANYGHNYLSAILIFAYPIALLSLLYSKSNSLYLTKISYLPFAYYFVIVVALFSTFSRGALLLLGLYTVFQVGIIHHQKLSKRMVLALLVGVLGIFSLFVFSFITVYLPKYTTNLTPRVAKQIVKPPLLEEGRFRYWKQAIQTFSDHPLFGTGPGTFYLDSQHYQSEPNQYSWFAHNFVLETLAESGVIGAGIFILPIMLLLHFLVHELSTHTSPRYLLFILVLLSFLYSNIDFSFNFLLIWLCFWSAAGLLAIPIDPQKKTNSAVSVLAIALVCLYYFYSISTLITESIDNPIARRVNFYLSLINSQRTLQYMQKTSQYKALLTPKLVTTIRWLHKKNPEVTYQLAQRNDVVPKKEIIELYKEAVVVEPTNLRYFRSYLTAVTDNPPQLHDALMTFISSYGKQIIKERIPTPSSEEMTYLTKFLDGKIFNDEVDQRNNFVRIFYGLGLSSLKVNPDRTEVWWKLARDSNPSWSYLHVELAGLAQQQKDSKKSKDYLYYCLQFPDAKTHCQDVLDTGLSSPLGSWDKNVLAIPHVLP